MKTKFITSVMVIVFTSASLFATDPAATVELINQKGSTVYKVVYRAPGTGKATLKISGKDGIMFSDVVTFTNGFAYPIDFKGLTGEYTVEVLSKTTRFKQTVAIENKKPAAYVRVIGQPNSKELLTITSAVPADFTIRVFDMWNHEVFTKVEKVNNNYAVLLNVAELTSGYSIEVTEAAGTLHVIRK